MFWPIPTIRPSKAPLFSPGGMIVLAVAAACLNLRAQAPAPAPAPAGGPKNLVSNGSFEQVVTNPNLYDGVDAANCLRVRSKRSAIFDKGRTFVRQEFCATVNYVDVDADKLPDLVVSSPDGHLLWYPNKGSKEQPSFTHAHLVQTCLGWSPSFHLCDFRGSGKFDILFSTMDGVAYLIPNLGTPKEPKWIEAMDKPRWEGPSHHHEGFLAKPIPGGPTGKDPLMVCTYGTPVFADWNKDGLPDLIMGEGSYSANSIYIWLNSGGKNNPVFKGERMYLAYGDGREQLAPWVYDWNSDGIPDLLVGDRYGRLALHLGTQESIKNPKKIETVEMTKYVKAGGREQISPMLRPHICDYNNDGIPDLLFSAPGGGIKAALGKGKREDPELASPTDIKGVDFHKDFKSPASWSCGTFSGIPEVVDSDTKVEAKEGKKVFHFSYFEKYGHYAPTGWGWDQWWWRYGEPRTIFRVKTGWQPAFTLVSQINKDFLLGKQFELSFWYRGRDMHLCSLIHYSERIPNPDNPGAKPYDLVHNYPDDVTPGPNWTLYKKVYLLEGFKGRTFEPDERTKITYQKEIDTNNKVGVYEPGRFPQIHLRLHGNGEAWIDDVKLIEVTK
ncbi:MAG: VCBS repeat-containing protein [Verrucomicrobiae bacterium]|nr:VCBS repeat-containing protein [Verrucomicrobiae bacterium]